MWGIYEPKFIRSNGNSVSHPEDLENSILMKLLDEKYIVVPKGFKSIITYSKSLQSEKLPFNEELGQMIHFQVSYDGKMYGPDKKSFEDSVFVFTAITNSLASQKTNIIKANDDITIVESLAEKPTVIPGYNILLAPIMQTINNNTGELFNISEFIKTSLDIFRHDRDKMFVARELSDKMIGGLIEKGIPIKLISSLEELEKNDS